MLFAQGSSFCCAAVWRTNSPCCACPTANICGELEGLEALSPGSRWTEAKAGLPLQSHVRWILPAPQQAGPAAFTPRWGDSGPGDSCLDIDFSVCTLDPCTSFASIYFAKAINLSPLKLKYASVYIKSRMCSFLWIHSLHSHKLYTNLQSSPNQYYYHTKRSAPPHQPLSR